MEFLQVLLEQGTPEEPKKEHLFLQFLENLHNTAHHKKISLELFGYGQYTYFFITCEKELLKLVEGLIYSNFPNSEIRPMKDYTSFYDPKAQTLVGTELRLEMPDIYPIKTYEGFDNDSLSGLFSVISKLDRNEQAWVQIVLSPRHEDWQYHVGRRIKLKINNLARKFRLKNYVRLKDKKAFFNEETADFVHKSEHHPFEIQIKVGAVADTKELAKKNLSALTKAFYQFNKTDRNSFGTKGLSEGDSFLNEYKKRKLTNSMMVSAHELATLYHFPNSDHVSHIVHILAKKHEPPKNLPTDEKGGEVSMFGTTNYHNNFQDFGIKREDRRRHLYAVGKSGTGKSKLLELLIKSDIEAGKGVGVLDPHGDLVDNILRFVPEHRMKDVIYFDPADTEFPIAFNPLEKVDDKFKMQITIGFIDIFKKLFGSNWSNRLEHVLRYTTLALLDSPNTTVLSILKMLSDKNYRQTIIARIEDSVVKNFWVNEFAGWSEKFDAEAITPLLNKVGQLVSTNMIRNIIGQPKNTFDIRDIMDNQKILLMKVSKGLLGQENAALLGSMIITKIYQAAMARADLREEDRKDFYFYVDEFQNFATDTFAEILSEARKYRLCLTIAHQYVGQLNPEVRKTVFGNVGSIIGFRVGAEDATVLAGEYTPIFSVRDIINLGVREFYLKMSIDGELTEAFSGKTLNITYSKKDISKDIINYSREAYCMKKDQVEEMLKKWDEGKLDEGKPGDATKKTGDSPELTQDFDMPMI
ncbi:MAG: type IV secretory system conjugative DNA transfer family protein [Candidatus Gracilibacteria bacterium]